MVTPIIISILGIIILSIIVGATWIAYLRYYLAWEERNRLGMNYYGLPRTERQALRARIKARSWMLIPVLRLGAAFHRGDIATASIDYKGVAAPSRSCTTTSFHHATTYQPSEHDIFVVTQMRCGTTWMQQIVYEILHHGNGDLGNNSNNHICAVSPWLEAITGVTVESSPLLGQHAKRLIKTHLPMSLCPFSSAAKYIYVTRHPVNCFSSIVEFMHLMTGPFAPPVTHLAQWYCSDTMWWLSWPEHVAGWWEQAQHNNNVLFIHYEEILKDPGSAIQRIALHLGEGLQESEIHMIIHKASFQYMKQHEALFEMSPPNLFSVHGSYFDDTRFGYNKTITDLDRQYILNFCKQSLNGSSYPVADFYPDILKH